MKTALKRLGDYYFKKWGVYYPMEAQFHHVTISVQDMDKQLAFYRDTLGYELAWSVDLGGNVVDKIVDLENTDFQVVVLRGYGAHLELIKYRNPVGQGSALKRQCDFGLTHFALRVNGIHKVYQELVQKGVAFNSPPREVRQNVRATYFRDPEGTTVELVEYL
jgi:catechol 2,3-dioxygenase-like lactoylglutathione lyase family enzyme